MQKRSHFHVFTLMMVFVAVLAFLSAVSAHAMCPDDIVGYWKLDETTPGTYADFIKDNDGIGAPSPAPATGIVNGAQSFTGSERINVAGDNSFDWQVDESFSIEFWMRTGTSIPGANIVAVGRDDDSTPMQWWVGIVGGVGVDAGTVRFRLIDNDDVQMNVTGTTVVADDDSWHHVVAVRDESTNENILYVDGVEEGRESINYTAGFDSTRSLNIGHLAAASFFTGLIDEVALYDRALDIGEVQAHRNAGLAGIDYCSGSAPFVPFPDDTISLWQLDEPTPAGPDGIYVDAFDGNDGIAPGTVNPTAATGIVNGAQSFAGAQRINVAGDNSFDWQVDESFSIEFWMRTGTSIPGANIVAVGRDDDSTPMQWWVGIVGGVGVDAGTVRFRLIDNDDVQMNVTGTTVVADDDSWHHVVAVRDESTNENILYVDGVEEGRESINYTAGFDSTRSLNIGHLAAASFFTGLIDEVALYDRALDIGEVQAHRNAGLLGNGVQSLRPEPTADAGPNQNATEGDTVTLDGSGSSDADGAIVDYLWEQVTGTTVTLTDVPPDSATFTAPNVTAAGETLTFQLTVTDDDGQSSIDTIAVIVSDDTVTPPPVATGGGGGGGGCFITTLF